MAMSVVVGSIEAPETVGFVVAEPLPAVVVMVESASDPPDPWDGVPGLGEPVCVDGLEVGGLVGGGVAGGP